MEQRGRAGEARKRGSSRSQEKREQDKRKEERGGKTGRGLDRKEVEGDSVERGDERPAKLAEGTQACAAILRCVGGEAVVSRTKGMGDTVKSRSKQAKNTGRTTSVLTTRTREGREAETVHTGQALTSKDGVQLSEHGSVTSCGTPTRKGDRSERGGGEMRLEEGGDGSATTREEDRHGTGLELISDTDSKSRGGAEADIAVQQSVSPSASETGEDRGNVSDEKRATETNALESARGRLLLNEALPCGGRQIADAEQYNDMDTRTTRGTEGRDDGADQSGDELIGGERDIVDAVATSNLMTINLQDEAAGHDVTHEGEVRSEIRRNLSDAATQLQGEMVATDSSLHTRVDLEGTSGDSRGGVTGAAQAWHIEENKRVDNV